MKKRKDIENNLWAEDYFPNNFKIGFKKKDKIVKIREKSKIGEKFNLFALY